MTEGQVQRKFTLMIAQLIEWAYANGYELTFGDAYRDPRLHGGFGITRGYGSANSQHKRRMAVDLNLFINGAYISDGSKYAPLGEYWESIGGAWGGRWNDGNHFSIAHNGYR